MEKYDVVIIGAGPGGYVGAIRAAQLGLSVAVVERDPAPGGTCLHRGCIPTKVLLHAAGLVREVPQAARKGVRFAPPELDLGVVMKEKQRTVRRLSAGVGSLLKQNGVRLIKGEGRIAGAGKVAVSGEGSGEELRASNIIVATGSEPASLPNLPFDGTRIVGSDEAIAFDAVPGSLLVVGGGAVGLELGLVWSSFGTKVTVVELMPHILPGGDPELSETLAAALKKQGMIIAESTTVTGAAVSDEGVEVTLKGPDGTERKESFEKVLVAVGRKTRLENVGLESVGIIPERGRVPVDEFGRTSAEGVYAIGDITPGPQLAHSASAEAIAAVEAIAGRKTHPVNKNVIPACVYTHPEAASVGMTEEKAKEAGFTPKVGRFPFVASGKALIEGDQTGWVKIVADRETNQVLGVHIVGLHATELIAEATLAVQLECTCEELVKTVHAHPTLAETVAEAAHSALGGAIHFFEPR